MSQAFATSSPPSRSARALHRAEDISTALKASVNVYKRQLVNEVLGPLVTEFVRNFGREGATPIHSARLQCQPSRSRPGRQIHQTLMLFSRLNATTKMINVLALHLLLSPTP